MVDHDKKGHGHSHSHSHDHHGSAKNISVAFFLNLGFTIIEVVGGILTNSVAILSDAVHDLGDTLTLGMSWWFEKISFRERTEKMTFGYKRFSLLGALLSSIVLLGGSVVVLIRAVPRIMHPEEVESTGMLILAIVGVAVNGVAVLRLRGGHKLNERVVMLHLLEDVLGWIAVLIVSIVLMFADIPILDPILSLCITGYVLFKIYPNLKSTLKIFLQYSPEDIDLEIIRNDFLAEDQVESIHDVHLWSIDGKYNIFSCHVVLQEDLSLSGIEDLKKRLKEVLSEYGIQHGTLEFELIDIECRSCENSAE